MSKRARPFGVGTRKGGFDAVAQSLSAYDYHAKVPVETTQKGGRDFWLRPLGGVANKKGPFFFNLDALHDEWLQLNRA